MRDEFIDNETPRISVEQLAKQLEAIDERVVLVAPHVLRYIIKADLGLGDFWSTTPHHKSHIISPAKLARLDILSELGLAEDRDFPKLFILLIKPDSNELGNMSKREVLVEYWRLLFHARVHLEFDRLRDEGKLEQKDIETLLQTIGNIEFSEIKEVLHYENYLTNPEDIGAVLSEFCAYFLELRYFSKDLRKWYFPTLSTNFEAIDQFIDQHIDSGELFDALRPGNIEDPDPPVENTSEEPQETFQKLIKEADEQFHSSNYARASILWLQASRIGPGGKDKDTRNKAQDALKVLIQELRDALAIPEEKTGAWRLELLDALLEKSDQGNLPQEARILFDLQNIFMEARTPIYEISPLNFLLRKDWRVPLPRQQEILIIRHLERAKSRLPAARIKAVFREELKKVISRAIEVRQERLRESLTPILSAAFQECEITADTAVGKVSLQKITNELLDTIIERGFLHYSTLRDTFSRNDYKIRDVRFSRFFYGDAVIRLNHKLKTALPDLYKAGEIYHRVFHRFSDLFSGTRFGEFLTWYFLMPIGIAVGTLYTLEFTVIKIAAVLTPDYKTFADFTSTMSITLVSLFLVFLLHSKMLRRHLFKLLIYAFNGIQFVFYKGPKYFYDSPFVQKILRHKHARNFIDYVLRPARATLMQWLCWWFAQSPQADSLPLHVAIFVLFAMILNTARWKTIQEATGGWFRKGWKNLHDKLVSLLSFVQFLVKTLGDFIEILLYAVDERLRYRKGDTHLSVAFKFLSMPFWLPTRYLARMFYTTCVDPRLNPAKLGITIMSDKVLSPFTYGLLVPLESWFNIVLIKEVSAPLALIVSFLPAAFLTFIIWELKENRKLFFLNRPPEITAAPITKQGQTLSDILNPSNYGHTLPAIYAKLRKFERDAQTTGDWVHSRKQRELLEDINSALQEFLKREFLPVLSNCIYWKDNPLAISDIRLGHNNIFMKFKKANSKFSITLLFEWASGWVRTQVIDQEGSDELNEDQHHSFESALLGLYKKSGVDLVHSQLEKALAQFPVPVSHQIIQSGVKVWPSGNMQEAVLYRLEEGVPSDPESPYSMTNPSWNPPKDVQFYFPNVDLNWDRWTKLWDEKKNVHAPDLTENLKLPHFVPAPQKNNDKDEAKTEKQDAQNETPPPKEQSPEAANTKEAQSPEDSLSPETKTLES